MPYRTDIQISTEVVNGDRIEYIIPIKSLAIYTCHYRHYHARMAIRESITVLIRKQGSAYVTDLYSPLRVCIQLLHRIYFFRRGIDHDEE